VHVEAENILTGERTHTNSAYIVYVALGDDTRPTEVPPLILETDEEWERYERARQRQAERLSQRR